MDFSPEAEGSVAGLFRYYFPICRTWQGGDGFCQGSSARRDVKAEPRDGPDARCGGRLCHGGMLLGFIPESHARKDVWASQEMGCSSEQPGKEQTEDSGDASGSTGGHGGRKA